MSQEKVEVVRRWLWAFENSDEAVAELTHPEIERAPSEGNHTVFHGVASVMELTSGWLDPRAEHSIEIEELLRLQGNRDWAGARASSARDAEPPLHRLSEV